MKKLGGVLLGFCFYWLLVTVSCVEDTPSERAQKLLAQMNLTEKIDMVHGIGGPYVGNVPANERLKIPSLNLNDGPQGFRSAYDGTSTQWPSGLTIGASWSKDNAYAWGQAMGEEFVGKGANVQLGPGVCVARVPVNGRNFEYISGEDPFLGNQMVGHAISGIQSKGVIANVKHFILNNQETNRFNVSANVDERTVMEIYGPPFEGAVDANVGSVMCSYNKINQVPACEDYRTLNQTLKEQYKFKYWVMSDWGATHTTYDSALNGLDQEMPDGVYFGKALETAVSNGNISEAVLDDKVLRILTAMFAFGLFDNPNKGDIKANVTTDEHNKLARKLAGESVVMLTNNGVLPIAKSVQNIAVLGRQGQTHVITGGGGSGAVYPPYVVSPVVGITNRFSGKVEYNQGTNITEAVAIAKQADVAIVFMATTSSEGADRVNLSLPYHEELLASAVGAAQPNTVVVAITPGAILTPWSNVVNASLVMFMPGQEIGNAIADVLFGDVNPGGKLPLTFPNKENEVEFTDSQYPGIPVNNPANASYSEKLDIGYRWYATHKVTPKFAFGHGLSYTTFEYGTVSVDGRNVSIVVKNTGQVMGSEVVQLYLSFPPSSGEPPLQLKGFEKTLLQPTRSSTITFILSDRDLSIWNVTTHEWEVQHGTFTILIGSSSQDIRSKASFVI